MTGATPESETLRLRHGRIELALHRLTNASSGPDAARLLLLHELGGRAPRSVPDIAATWPGLIWALDFTGHGASSQPRAGGYTAEMLMADADAALAEIGPATVLGFGLGAYVALLLAGSRPELVRGAVLCAASDPDGGGLFGGGPEPPEIGAITTRPAPGPNPDPQALSELSHDVRPPGYARLFVRQAAHRSTIDRPITVSRDIPHPRPPWLEAILEPASTRARQGAVEGSGKEALERYRGAPGDPD